MARFITSFAHPFTRPHVRRDRPLLLVLPAAAAATDEREEPSRGPGWFDSSWDLRSGLEVHEGLPGDAQLHEWIEACLRSAPVASAVLPGACAA
jgi:hypothetical protein